MKTGFIGLGNLGKAIAKRLLSQGIDLIVWNRSRDKALDLGVPIAESPERLISQVERVLVLVFDSQASEEVIFGSKGLIHGEIKGKTVIDLTTNHYKYAEMAYERLKGLGVYYLDAPVLGSVIPAQKGELTVLVSGDEERFNEQRPLFEKFSKDIYYVGKAGNATKLKLINNMVLGGFMEVLAEAIATGELAGFKKEQIIEILNSGAGRSYLLDAKKTKLLQEDFSTHFSVDLIYKDLHYAQELLRDLKGFSFCLQNAKEAYGLARAKGLGGLDFSAIYRIFKP